MPKIPPTMVKDLGSGKTQTTINSEIEATANAALPKAGGTMTGLLKLAAGASIASAATVNLTAATGNTVHITGTTGINAWTLSTGQVMDVIFDGVLTLTHHATTNNLPTGANITTAANDRARIYYDGTAVWVMGYTRASGLALATAAVFTSSYVSPEQTITAAGTLTLTHGLPTTPKMITAELVCKVADAGYSVNEVISMPVGCQGASSSQGISVIITSTNLVVRYGSTANAFGYLNKSSGAFTSLSNTSWRLILRAYA